MELGNCGIGECGGRCKEDISKQVDIGREEGFQGFMLII